MRRGGRTASVTAILLVPVYVCIIRGECVCIAAVIAHFRQTKKFTPESRAVLI